MAQALKTRILPGLRSQYAIVALPYWAWFWLDDHIERYYPSGYKEFLSEVSDMLPSEELLASALEEYALFLQTQSLNSNFKLSNDNTYSDDKEAKIRKRPAARHYPEKLKLTAIYKLFGFMSCATTLEAVWQRRHYRNEKSA